MIGGGVFFFLSGRERTVVEIIPAEEREIVVLVDVAGAVVNPGVYELHFDARLNDALVVAGGMSSRADRIWVEKNLNLASRVKDGQKIYLPANDEYQQTDSGQDSTAKVNLNMATQSGLESLPGIGEVRAKAIIESRPVVTWEKLEDVLSEKIVEE
ncbi:helix-hairpin-helix domain-containing protein, partial [Patescibacteria group bacterium]|nr:helix-hairpin-helix domain-containing protein [Patescibacteria group bacterium]